MTPIKRRYTVQVDPGLTIEVDATITHDRLAFEVDTTGLTESERQWLESPENVQDIGDAVAAHHRQVELEAWAKLTEETPNE